MLQAPQAAIEFGCAHGDFAALQLGEGHIHPSGQVEEQGAEGRHFFEHLLPDFSGFFFDDVTAEWANDLIATMLCWLQMGWCWIYSMVLDLLYETTKAALPVLPTWFINTSQILNYYDYANAVVPLTEIGVLFLLWLPFYIIIRVLYKAQPWAG